MIQSNINRPTLLQYIDNYRNGKNDLDDIVQKSKSNPTNDISSVNTSLSSLKSMEELVAQVTEGKTNVSATTISNMTEFYMKQVSGELNDTLKNYDLATMPDFAFKDGMWQSTASEELTEKQSQFLDYLNRDARLSTTMQQTLKLSELNELTHSQQLAATFDKKSFNDDEIKDYLLSTRTDTLNLSYFTISDSGVKVANAGIAQYGFDAVNKAKQS
ncbi:hypothetical protein OE749_05585 [Aestuariibacter sp. AA17]|uniref:Flagellar hook-associated protein 2 C-terminal domain-containing protein n=1 Tax=Fluctibacter corallii TaxID=2984329 RepID=A0ABT3A6D0_9ALTE|nr:hypothetical protein [Aestuariibacter sp. AA17]MCV2884158.1 hypothetical protein [Aestuariibacter sp. AA17]